MTEHVVLLHGIWLRGFTLALLARRLRHAGFEVSSYDYASVTRGPDDGVQHLETYLAALSPGVVHLVGHSLGGLLALHVAARARLCERRPRGDLAAGAAESSNGRGRIVCLGTPLRGSAVARVLAGWPPLRWTLGEARELLCAGLDRLPADCDVGAIAGRVPVGFGMLVPGLTSPHDGTVAVAETRIDGLADHAVVATTHSGLLLSDQVARLASNFLRSGRFASA